MTYPAPSPCHSPECREGLLTPRQDGGVALLGLIGDDALEQVFKLDLEQEPLALLLQAGGACKGRKEELPVEGEGVS